MKEFFEPRRLTGTIRLNLKERGYWEKDKAQFAKEIKTIIQAYQRQGYRMTLRQLYYQLVANADLPNHLTVYAKLGAVLDDLRYSGEVDWDAIVDRGRVPKLPYWVRDISHALTDTAEQYRLNRQRGQSVHCEVWVEKDAISEILYGITQRYHVQLMVNKGYSSSPAMQQAYKRFVQHINAGRRVVVLYFGDHDPSGLNMVEDIDKRIKHFLARGERLERAKVDKWWQASRFDSSDLLQYEPERKTVEKVYYGGYLETEEDELDYAAAIARLYLDNGHPTGEPFFEVRHIGLTWEQIQEFNPPENPAKMSDPRAEKYVAQFGRRSWEVDALRPQVMERIVEEAIEQVIDVELYEEVMAQEAQEREIIEKMAADYAADDEEE